MSTGVYTITNLVNNKIYIGSSSTNLNKRIVKHKWDLSNNKHVNKHLQSSYNKYGKENFVFEILEECDIEFCLSQEQYWINMLNVCNTKFGYNKKPNTMNSFGYRHTKEALKKMSEEGKTRIISENLKFKRSRPIYQYDINGNLIGTFSSIKECIEKTGICRASIDRALFKRNPSKKYFFEFQFKDRTGHYQNI